MNETPAEMQQFSRCNRKDQQLSEQRCVYGLACRHTHSAENRGTRKGTTVCVVSRDCHQKRVACSASNHCRLSSRCIPHTHHAGVGAVANGRYRCERNVYMAIMCDVFTSNGTFSFFSHCVTLPTVYTMHPTYICPALYCTFCPYMCPTSVAGVIDSVTHEIQDNSQCCTVSCARTRTNTFALSVSSIVVYPFAAAVVFTVQHPFTH